MNNTDYNSNIPTSYNQQNYYNSQAQPIAQPDDGNALLATLSFFIPIAGLIVYLVEKDEKPKTAKQSGKCAIWGVIASVIFSIIITFAMFGVAFGILDRTFDVIENTVENSSVVQQTEDIKFDVAGKEFYDEDFSKISFKEDGTFTWLQDETNPNDNFYKGTYTVRYGAEAEKYLKNTDFPISVLDMKEIDNLYGVKDFYTQDNLIVFTLKHTEALSNGKNLLENADTDTTYYFGFISDKEKLQIAAVQIATGGSHTFDLIEEE